MRAVRGFRRAPRVRHAAGFGLIEVLVSLVVIAVGLLGVAKLNALAIGNTRNSGSRAIAAIYAGSISAAMHANAQYWQTAGTTTTDVTATNGTLTVDSVLAGQTLDCAYAASNTAPSCNPVQMAAHDLRTWSASLQQLPAGSGRVTCNVTQSPITCTVAVSWNEKTIGNNAATSSTQPARQYFFALVQP